MLSPDARIVVVMGGWSAEREVALQSGAAVIECLRRAGQPVLGFDLSPDEPRSDAIRRLLDSIREFRADAVYLALHGPLGEDGTMQGLLELAGVPFNGSGVSASALGLDKVLAKQVFVANKITTPRYVLVPRGTLPKNPPLPLAIVVKPRSLGSSIGVSLVEKAEEFAPAFAGAAACGQDVIVEQYISGRELQACVIDGEALPLIEVVTANRFYDYEAKYTAGKSEHKVPAPLPRKQYEAAQRLAVAAYAALGCEGAARVELIAEATGTLYVIEVNTLPGMTVTSLLPEAAREAGLSFLDLVRRELERAITRRGGRRAPGPAEAGTPPKAATAPEATGAPKATP